MTMRCLTEHVYNGNDNAIVWVLTGDRTPIADLSAITRVTLDIGPQVIDSDIVGSSVIWWTDQETILWEGVELDVDVVKMALGGLSITPGIYKDCTLRVFEPFAPDGVVWIKDTVIQVH